MTSIIYMLLSYDMSYVFLTFEYLVIFVFMSKFSGMLHESINVNQEFTKSFAVLSVEKLVTCRMNP